MSGFLDVLATCTEAAQKMDFSNDDWKPDDGTYSVVVQDVKTGLKVKDGITNAWVKPVLKVLDGEFENRTFSDFMYFSPNQTEDPSPGLKSLLRFATCIAGREMKDPVEAGNIAVGAIDAVLTLDLFTTTSKKNGNQYRNIRYQTCESGS
jgi:hypothetical protein